MPIQTYAEHFPEWSAARLEALTHYEALLREVNTQINLVSRKDMDSIAEHHILHSLAIAKVFSFPKSSLVCDLGTGGGLPGIPLAICFPEVEFVLMDSIGKKVRAVRTMVNELNLENVQCRQARLEEEKISFDYIVGRAVTAIPELHAIVRGRVKRARGSKNPNGVIYLKGGDFEDELKNIGRPFRVWNISDFFASPYFETKKVLWADLG